MEVVSRYRAWYTAFTTIKHEIQITDELHERCFNVDSSLPRNAYGLEYLNFGKNNPYCMADYMESYIELICTYERLFGGDIYQPDIFYEKL